MNNFSHSGDLGDIIYSLPTIRAAGGGKLYLYDHPGKTAHGMTKEKVSRLKPLLIEQDYIEDVEFLDYQRDHSLNGFRDHMGHGNLADAHLATHGFDHTHRFRAWIKVDNPNPRYRFIFSRSPRYHNSQFPWRCIVERYGAQSAFVGFPDEHEAFCSDFGFVPFAEEQADFLQLARLIAGCEMFVGNQSSPLAVAHGMKHKLIMEICPDHNHHHCVYERFDCIIGWGSKIELPEFDNVIPKFELPRDWEMWREVYHGGEYALPLKLPDRTRVIDIGSHIGAFALTAIHRGAEHVTCVEPSGVNQQHLSHNLKGFTDQIEIVDRAIWFEGSGVHMGYRPEHEGTMLSIGVGDCTQTRTVTWTELAERLDPTANNIVKCDSEGGEYVFLHSDNDLSLVDLVYMEAHDHVVLNENVFTAQDAVHLLENHGFEVQSHRSGPTTTLIVAQNKSRREMVQ